MSEGQDEHLTAQERTTAPVGDARLFGAPPLRIGRYIVGERIGSGGMGVVYRARHCETGADVALKLIRGESVTEETVARLKQEAKALGSLRHPGIAAVHDAGTEEIDGVETPYIAMEYLPGARPITAYAKDRSEREKLELFVSVCRAVDHANGRGVVHRDLKPSNILVDGDGVAKVIDFGVAKVLGAAGERSHVTEQGRLVGTPEYMSPEQVQGRSELIDARTDVYGLGVVLYELLCGRLPYEVSRRSPLEAMRVICDDPPTLPTQVRRGFSDEMQTILLKMLAKERPRRYQSAGEAADDIERYLRGRPVHARRDTARYRLRKALSRAKHENIHVTGAAIMLLGMAVSMLAGPKLLYQWTGMAARYAGWLTGTAPAPSIEPVHVAVIGLREPTALADLAGPAGAGPVNPRDPSSWRFAYGLLMKRLAECQPRAVGFDFRFISCTQAEWLVDGMEQLRSVGVGTVVGTQAFFRVRERPGEVCDDVVNAAWGWGAIAVSESTPGNFVVRLGMVKAGTQAGAPSLGTAIFAASRRPDAIGYGINITDAGVSINYLDPPGGRPRGAPTDDLLTQVESGPADADEQRLVSKGDLLSSAAVRLDEWALSQRPPHTQLIEEVLREDEWPIERLRQWVHGKTVIVIDLRAGEDTATTRDGVEFHKGYLWATWLEGALRDGAARDAEGAWAKSTSIRGAGREMAAWHILIGAVLGSLLLFMPSTVHRAWSVGCLVAVSACFVAVSLVALHVWGVLMVPLLGLFALWVSGLLCILFPRPLQA
ncbi:MAG: serine/threonine protein kinase [Phycisphaerales bacterium]|nr:serine/threonine protein kinase [Phycisphaerales bacterium]